MILLVTAMAMPKMAWAEITPQQPSGGGTSENPYQIGTPEELYWFAGLVNGDASVCIGGLTQNTSANAVLTADITVNTGVLKSDGSLADNVSGFTTWTPIGNLTLKYAGTFDGQGHTISGLYFKDSNTNNVGLFGGNQGKIKNVGVVDSYFKGLKYVGGVCGYNDGGTITGSYNSGTVSGSGNFVGGVCGQNFLSGTITGCYNTGTVSGSGNYVGGVCGRNEGGTITGCNNTGKVSGNTGVGGVCGYNVNGGTITGCYNTGTVSGSDDVGGVCGANYEGGTITGCYNTGTVSGSSGVGGVCGANYAGGKITGCYNTGTVSGSDSYVGGVCGFNTGKITGCYTNDGKVNGGGTGTVTYCEVKSDNDFTNGTVCTPLNTALQDAKASVRFYQEGENYPEIIMNVPSLDKEVYQISNKEELYAFALLVNKKVDASANAVLTADITVNIGVLKSDGSLADDVSGFTTWTPIGNNKKEYTGTFDGQGHTISGLYFKDSKTGYVGLFGCNKGTIKNVGVVDSYFKGLNYVGGVCGYNDGGTITGCNSTGTVSGSVDSYGSSYVGGVCGYNNGGTITGCNNTGTVSGEGSSVGGVCGANYEGGKITGCYNTGTVSGSRYYVGGVCGHNSSGTITGCHNTGTVSGRERVGGVCGANSNGTITGCHNTGTVSGEDISYVGGVCGQNYGTITDCYNEGVVSAGGSGSYVGGVCGHNVNEGTITGCYNKGTVSGTGRASTSGSYVGGVCGYNEGGTITGCYNTGEVSGESTVNDSYPDDSYVGGSYVGGVCGANSGIITDCYNTGKVSGTGTVNGELVGGSYVEGSYVGGVCGYNYGGTITGCYNTGEVSGKSTVSGTGKVSGSYVGGVCGFNGGTITGCYNTGTVSGSSSVGGVCGHNSSGTITGCYNIGKVSGNSYVGGVCGQNSSGTITNCYYLIGTATGGIDSNNVTGSAEGKTEDDFKNGEVCTPLNTALKKANASVRFYKGANYPEIINLPSIDDKGVYQISNKEELYAFAQLVNKNVETSANAVLTANITVNTGVLKSDGTLADNYSRFKTWTPIGSKDVTYTGTFDGQGHTISGLYFNDSNTDYVGLFGYNSGTIKNVGVVDSYFYGKNYVGGVCGGNNGTITGCYNKGTVSGSSDVGGVCGSIFNGFTITGCYNTGTVSGNSFVGGVCGRKYNGGKITGCYNTGKVKGGSSVGGVCGYNYYGGTITGCYNTGEVSGSGSVGGVCGSSLSEIINCYFNSSICDKVAIGTNSGTATNVDGKTEAQFTSGEVCYLLSQGSTVTDGEKTTYYSGSVWGQQLGTDNYPVFGDYKVIKAAKGNNNTYWATFSNQSSDMDLSDLTVYTAKVSEGILTLTPCSDNIVAKGEGVLVKGNSEYLNAKARNEKIAYAEANNDLVATPAEPTVINATTDHVLYRLTYNKVASKEGLGFYLSLVKDENGNVDDTSLGKKLKVTPGKAYLKVAKSASGSAPIRGFVIGEDDNTTGIDVITINGIDINDSKVDDSVYDLMGRKVSKPAKGIYIKNGKKIIIK